ncbi:hypothetical protein [Pseudomonas amygdali]|uniref:Lipoprotein n=2 Tax=Pseudomonas amygdali pv. lachrymans TaxID=53707 RepID=A0ABR5KU16_PSEAV|nr:hypothetical protein [Pseudomonas amygdali]AXH59656.1 hypothetical protein PLA107_031005 [Pseudomonas amygdali pv. lachrymans str. M301315]KPC17083.1 Uncharacterized protein AC499_0285 [Pseudomonas amygdali pv. lachrymans]KPC18042.1 Uncharacterized protein AC499_1244 [Pseudomonas amygdali pv. lachrymans]RMT06378.1 hypothetical protein ALP54_03567 [Pseudomonas amygdali pv. lachrymans]
MNLEKVSAAFLVALVLCTGLATSPAHAGEVKPEITLDNGGAELPVSESFVMFDKDSSPEKPTCLRVQRWVDSIATTGDDGKSQSIPMVKQATRSIECTPDAKPYEDAWQARARLLPGSQPANITRSKPIESYVMYAQDSTPKKPKCVRVERWLHSVETSFDDKGNIIFAPLIKTLSADGICTESPKPYKDPSQADMEMVPVNKPAVHLQ